MSSHLSAASPGALLAKIRAAGGLTRQQLLDETGTARSTLFSRLDLLAGAGLIYEASRLSSTGGRPASVISFDGRDRVVLTIDIGHHRATVSLADLEGRSRTEEVVARGSGPLPEFVDALGGVGERLLADADGVRLLGVGLALPAPVNSHTGGRLSSVAPPDGRYPIISALARRFGTDVSVENDARALALGAASEVPPLADDGVLIGVKWSTGVGLGLITGGHVLRGYSGAAGDLGHLLITPGTGPACSCGRRGCLAAYVSGWALVRDLDRPDVSTVADVASLYDADDARTVEPVHDAARTLGTHLGGFVQVADPQHVAFGGFLGGRPAITEHVIAAIKPLLSDRISDAAQYRVVNGDHTTASGLVTLVVAHALDPEVIDRRVLG